MGKSILRFITRGAAVGLTNNMEACLRSKAIAACFSQQEPAIPMKRDTSTGQPLDKFTDTMQDESLVAS
jgi:transcription initiation factor TFIID subunit TAF12